MARRYALLDVFTNRALAGNPLAVVLDGEGLSDERMQAIAKEFNLSETVFVLPADNPAHSAKVRIFTPARELPFAGHPTVGTAILLAHERFGEVEADADAVVVLEENIGNVRCGVVLKGGAAGFAEFDVPKLSVPSMPVGSKEPIAAALGLSPHEIGFENHVPSCFDAGVPFAFVPVANLDALSRAKPQLQDWDAAFGAEVHKDVYVYCRQTTAHDSAFSARMFAPTMGIAEDPATGAAAAAFAGVVHHFDELLDGTHFVRIEQGYYMGRPSLIDLEIDLDNGKLNGVRIGGQAVVVARGELYL
ncbi:PhzF family phenazine biosynthesis protein [Rhizobiales bacterium]|uniref:PhzF family phenazine biosynthesis protein n=1 Tax=Hongsoonwoonella zoysiae TaxID=2821844 RepID=UPI00155F808C|nr:PhzF family phenazine biosynthesis protein [Hongsoonwoonella zoysiae]NRG17886.1 PhzF family phenazine biosynthesis protein [Hongsoonwoonella zoysiae]